MPTFKDLQSKNNKKFFIHSTLRNHIPD